MKYIEKVRLKLITFSIFKQSKKHPCFKMFNKILFKQHFVFTVLNLWQYFIVTVTHRGIKRVIK